MKAIRLFALAALIVGGGLALDASWAQLAGTKRTDLQRQDLSIPGREVIQVLVELAPGVVSPKHTRIPARRSSVDHARQVNRPSNDQKRNTSGLVRIIERGAGNPYSAKERRNES